MTDCRTGTTRSAQTNQWEMPSNFCAAPKSRGQSWQVDSRTPVRVQDKFLDKGAILGFSVVVCISIVSALIRLTQQESGNAQFCATREVPFAPLHWTVIARRHDEAIHEVGRNPTQGLRPKELLHLSPHQQTKRHALHWNDGGDESSDPAT